MKDLFDMAYKENSAMWTRIEPPLELRSALKKVSLCKAIDIGCGEGYYSVYLAKKGFEVLGVDYSEKAISLAKKNAKKEDADIRFKVLDVLEIDSIKEKFGLAVEWGVLHHIEPRLWTDYVSKVAEILDKGATYITLAFNDKSMTYGKPGDKMRKTVIGTTIYYSSIDELRKLYSKDFEIIKSEIIPSQNKVGKVHMGNFFVMKKR